MGFKTLQIVFLALITFQTTFAADDSIYKVLTEYNEIKVMAYNVQNLFDAEHDEGKNDFEFLPVNHKEKENCSSTGKYAKQCFDTDWTSEKVQIKLDQIRKALEVQGTRPDFLVLVEVENPNIIQQLAEELGYSDFVMTNGPDKRGIDNAVLYNETKAKLVNFKEVEAKVPFATRNVSVANFQLDERFGTDAIIGIYPVHWPSQGGGASAAKARQVISQQVKDYVDDQTNEYGKNRYHAIILGDFNTLSYEHPHPVDDILLGGKKKSGVELFDVRHLAIKEKSPFIDMMPEGTYYYKPKREWNMFDRIILSGNFADNEGVEVITESYRINAHERVSAEDKSAGRIPFRYNHKTNKGFYYAGYSDHYAVHVKFKLN